MEAGAGAGAGSNLFSESDTESYGTPEEMPGLLNGNGGRGNMGVRVSQTDIQTDEKTMGPTVEGHGHDGRLGRSTRSSGSAGRRSARVGTGRVSSPF